MRILIAVVALLGMTGCNSSGPVKYQGTDARDVGRPADAVEPEASGLDDEIGAVDLVSDEDVEGGAIDAADDFRIPDGEVGAIDLVPETQELEIGPADTEVELGPVFDTTLVQDVDHDPWAQNLLFSVDHPGLTADKFIDKTGKNSPAIAALFGGETEPDADKFVLHVSNNACGQDLPPGKVVFLVHGAGGDADQVWVKPSLMGNTGLVNSLGPKGYCIFAITFPHAFGNNFNQAIQLAAALEQARLIAGVEQMTVIAHSKGGIGAVTYVSGFGEKVGLEYQGDVDRLVLLGVPLGGMDFSFRHPNFNYPVDLMNLSMPSAWDKILEWGTWKDIYDESIYGGAFDGSLQLTAAFDEEFPLSALEQDWYTTYYGGQGLVSHSLGIAKAIEMSSNFMADFKQQVVTAEVEVFVASGGNPVMNGVPWETSGPSDGLVFQASAQSTGMFENVVETKHFLLLNHWDLVASPIAQDWVLEILQ